ncbi:Srp72p [Dimargaris verticillata]|uniref:Signal recognition particle subunit SRP72 n=1 Tax=Dimargaris verticillata TaxID=2761393 RepID=A0A9W8EDF4_9FUNG|nr:Srp72p [Dimargaris verticillata]
MASTTELYGHLGVAVEQGDFNAALKHCETILAADPTDADAYRVQVACLVRLDKYTKALVAITEAQRRACIDLTYEKAYCLYRTQELGEAQALTRQLLSQASSPTARMAPQTLYAQICYRQGQYAEAIASYDELLAVTNQDAPEYNDLLTNRMASQVAQAHQKGPVAAKAVTVNTTTYELAYNSACGRISQGRYDEAEELLNQALRLGHNALKAEQMSDHEQQAELAPIEIQLGYVYQRQNKLAAAEAIYLRYGISQKGIDTVSAALVAHNVAAATSTYRPVTDTALRIRAKNLGLQDTRLLKEQLRVLAFNSALLKFYQRKNSACRRDCRRLAGQFPDYPWFDVLHAATWYQQGRPRRCLDELVVVTHKYSQDLAVAAALVQAQANLGLNRQALSSLQATMALLPVDMQSSAGIVSLTLWLCGRTRQPEIANQLMAAVSTHWAGVSREATPANVLRQRAVYYLKLQQPARALDDFKALVQQDPQDTTSMAALVLALASVDVDAAANYDTMLPVLPSHLDESAVDALEQVVANSRRYAKRRQRVSTGAVLQMGARKRTKPKRKAAQTTTSTTNQLDPDRWLPQALRSSNNPPAGTKAGRRS